MATTSVTIPWSHEFDGALTRARVAGSQVLLDFTAAPM
jgi:hypothetical protein